MVNVFLSAGGKGGGWRRGRGVEKDVWTAVIPPSLSSPLFSLTVSSSPLLKQPHPLCKRHVLILRARRNCVIYAVTPQLCCVCLFDTVRVTDCARELRVTRVYFKVAALIFIWFFCHSLDGLELSSEACGI